MSSEASMEEQVFCMQCKKLVPISHAINILKTGYYLYHFPMSMHCIACH